MSSTYLKAIKLEDFLTWKSLEMEFCNGMNVLIADNGVGKSVLFRIVDVIVNFDNKSRSEIEQYIRHGHSSSVAYFLFSNGRKYRFMFTNKDMIGEYIECGNSSILSEVRQQFIKDFSLVVEPSSGFISNMLDDSKKKFLVDTDVKSNAYFLDTLIKDEDIEKVIVNSEDRIKLVNMELAGVKTKISTIQEEIDSFGTIDLDSLEDRIEYNKDFIEYIESICGVYSYLEDIESSNSKLLEDISDLDTLESLIELNDLSNSINFSIEDSYKDIIDFELLLELNEVCTNFNKIENRICIDESLLELSNIVDNFNELENSNNCINYLNDINNIIESFDLIDESTYTLEINEVMNLSSIVSKFSEYEDINKVIKEKEDYLNKLNGQIIECPVRGDILYIDGECRGVM